MDYFDWYAAYLHRTCPVADAHLDLVTEVYRRRKKGERGVLNTYYREEFQKGGVNLVVASLFLGEDELEESGENGIFPKGALLKKSLEMLAVFYEDLEETKGRMQIVTDRDSLFRITAKRGFSRQYRVGIVLYLEGLDMLEEEPELLRCFHAMGVRGAALTWNRRTKPVNAFAAGCGRDDGQRPAYGKRDQAITDKGVQALFLMEKLGIFVDSSHLSREAAWLLPSFTKKAFAATHSNSAALVPHRRNLTDGEIEQIAKRGGVIGVNACRKFCHPRQEDNIGTGINACKDGRIDGENGEQNPCGYVIKDNTEKDTRGSDPDVLCDQTAYLIEKAGEDHVGFGLDLGEDTVLSGYRELPRVTAELLRRGFSVETTKKVLGGNWIRFLSEILQ